MKSRMINFLTNEEGAVTVDWVVLTAAVCGIALAAILSVFDGTQVFGDSVEAYLIDTPISELARLE